MYQGKARGSSVEHKETCPHCGSELVAADPERNEESRANRIKKTMQQDINHTGPALDSPEYQFFCAKLPDNRMENQ